jgi:cytochrome c oxidase assembly protein subunit 15
MNFSLMHQSKKVSSSSSMILSQLSLKQRFMSTATLGGATNGGSAAFTTAAKDVKVTKPIVAYWLYFNAAMVYAIVVVGGLTRLTESGLSIVEWNVISGMKAPRSEQEWRDEFEKYKQFPEYKL